MRSPWSAQLPRQSQQNSLRHWLHTMCMHPWAFSMGRLHLGHGLVFARIQLAFSLSALFLRSHMFTVAQSTCAAAMQQNSEAGPEWRRVGHRKEDAEACAVHWSNNVLAQVLPRLCRCSMVLTMAEWMCTSETAARANGRCMIMQEPCLITRVRLMKRPDTLRCCMHAVTMC